MNWPFQLTVQTDPADSSSGRKTGVSYQNESNTSLSIVSFNMLAESNLSPKSHPNLPRSYVSIVFDTTKRRELIKNTLYKLIFGPFRDLDVLCLQEIDLYEEVVEPYMKDLGYEGFCTRVKSTPKTRNNQSMAFSCAIFWRASLLGCVQQHVVEIGESEGITENGEDDCSLHCCTTKDIAKDDHENNESNGSIPSCTLECCDDGNALSEVSQSCSQQFCSCIALLKYKKRSNVIAVTSTQLCGIPGKEYANLIQSKYLLDKLNTVVSNYVYSKENAKLEDIPVLICGDMNSKPDSMTYRLFVDKLGMNVREYTESYKHIISEANEEKLCSNMEQLEVNEMFWNVDKNALPFMSSKKLDGRILIGNEVLSHSFKLQSLYSNQIERFSENEEMVPFTNVTHDGVRILDYIFFESEKLSIKNLMHVPMSLKEMNPLYIPDGHLIPSAYWPSDHLAIGGELIFKNETRNVSEEKNESTAVSRQEEAKKYLLTSMHPIGCECCPTNILSMFEMSKKREAWRRIQKLNAVSESKLDGYSSDSSSDYSDADTGCVPCDI